ncbi:hypothetical protein EBR78_00190 [bacterium]|nr:hypothetical protein [bacterium]NBX82129.1 hypothetical protein [bacterium]
MKFQFRLEKAAHFYEQKEALKKLELAELVRRVTDLKEKIEAFTNENQLNLMRTNRHQVISPAWLQFSSERSGYNLQSIKELNEQIEDLQLYLEKKKQELAEVMRIKKALEKVREKKWNEFKLIKNRKEQSELDEVSQLLGGKPE